MIHAVTPKLFHYAWGSTTSIPDMLGIEPTGQPVAEAWFGEVAEVVTADGRHTTLGDLITSNPTSALGNPELGELPYLVKLLAARQPLSIQVHPSAAAAEAGFARENSLGIPRTHPTRIYRDHNAKPEAILALGHFEMLAGFREPVESAALIRSLSVPALKLTAVLLSAGSTEAVRNAVTELCAWDVDAVSVAVAELAAACAGTVSPEYAPIARWISDLAEKFPHDVGVVLALLMNHVVVERFDLVFIDAGRIHTYLVGLGLEVMGNSDNVVRGGLTLKHIDVPELLSQLSFEPGAPFIIRSGALKNTAAGLAIPTNPFALSMPEIDEAGAEFEVDGPETVIVLEGTVTVSEISEGASAASIELCLGQAVFIGAITGQYRVVGRGRLARVTPGAPGA